MVGRGLRDGAAGKGVVNVSGLAEDIKAIRHAAESILALLIAFLPAGSRASP